MLSTTRIIKINKKRLFTNLRINQVYSKEQLVNELHVLADEIQKRTESLFVVKFNIMPCLHVELTSYNEIDENDK